MICEELTAEVLEAGSDTTARYACLFLFVLSGLILLRRTTPVERTEPINSLGCAEFC